jgi:hypothetical protein
MNAGRFYKPKTQKNSLQPPLNAKQLQKRHNIVCTN